MKVLVTGVAGQLGHDVMNELAKRGYEGIGSDIAKSYNGIQDGTPVVSMPYVQMDITDKASVEKVLTEVNADAVIHCAAWTAGRRQNLQMVSKRQSNGIWITRSGGRQSFPESIRITMRKCMQTGRA